MNEVAYYNEIDPFAAAWLRELIKAGVIAPGEVDERSIDEVKPEDLREFLQCHFFAGIGVWSYALRAAGWADDTAVWTGSCPCQSFSASGKRGGFSDQRHLWPAWFRLIRELRPDTIFGEQVASKDGLAWLDVVSADLEGAGYAIGTADLCAAGFGAPHIRQRLYFVAHASRRRFDGITGSGRQSRSTSEQEWGQSGGDSDAGRMADAERAEFQGKRPFPGRRQGRFTDSSDLGDAAQRGLGMRGGASGERGRAAQSEQAGGMADAEAAQRWRPGGSGNGERGLKEARGPGFTNGFWADAEWLWCRDQKYRPVEPGTFPLAHGAANRVGRLRGYGNALSAPVAIEFIKAYLEIRGRS